MLACSASGWYIKRVAVIDVSPESDDPIILINPEIIEVDGEQVGDEGCLSVPGKGER